MTYPIRSTICGITSPQDALHAANLGADAIGLVFYEASPRCVTIEQSQAIVSVLPAFVSVVALFVNAQPSWIEYILEKVPVDILQFHGDESDDFCRQFHRPFIKAVRVASSQDIQATSLQFPHAKALLLDAYHPHLYGGTGKAFDWHLLQQNPPSRSWILAGGLTPENIAQALTITQAKAVDVSGGVEVSKGVKDVDKMKQFLETVDFHFKFKKDFQ
ncbi:MAG: phosphoribosylanthranilate isomerase [Neisseriaceae bacterium]|nr:phosphoribosylanthranilate isomerase [Neisseriaceae bacterium]